VAKEEFKDGMVVLKDLDKKEQKTVKIGEIPEYLKFD
jgi:histidyl-tRNA synthetase